MKQAIILGLLMMLSGCASTALRSPCPNYGKSCASAPINHWDDTALSYPLRNAHQQEA